MYSNFSFKNGEWIRLIFTILASHPEPKAHQFIFHCVMQAVWYMMAKQGFQNIIVYLDDFLAIGATQEECTQAYKVLLQLLQDLGFTISEGKLVQALNFYYNASTGQASWLSTNNQLQWLAGKLNWTCRAVYSGQTFLYQVIHTINSLSLGAKYCLTLSFCHDTAWWVNFLRAFNGKRFLDDRPTVDVMTDACTLVAGGYFGAIGFISIPQLTNPDGLLYIFTIRRPWRLYSLLSSGDIYGRIIGLSFTVITNQLRKLSTKALLATRLLRERLGRFSGCLRSIIFTLLQFTLKVIVTLLRMLFLLHKRDHLFSFYSFLYETVLNNSLDIKPLGRKKGELRESQQTFWGKMMEAQKERHAEFLAFL